MLLLVAAPSKCDAAVWHLDRAQGSLRMPSHSNNLIRSLCRLPLALHNPVRRPLTHLQGRAAEARDAGEGSSVAAILALLLLLLLKL